MQWLGQKQIYISKQDYKAKEIYQNYRRKFNIIALHKDHNIKEVNSTSIVKHSKPLFYSCKHKFRIKMHSKTNNKKNTKSKPKSLLLN